MNDRILRVSNGKVRKFWTEGEDFKTAKMHYEILPAGKHLTKFFATRKALKAIIKADNCKVALIPLGKGTSRFVFKMLSAETGETLALVARREDYSEHG